jgi:hypothetical protein
MTLAWDGRHPARMWARKQRNIHRFKPLSSSVTEDSRLCVTVTVKCSHEMWKSSVNSKTNSKPVDRHLTHDNIMPLSVSDILGIIQKNSDALGIASLLGQFLKLYIHSVVHCWKVNLLGMFSRRNNACTVFRVTVICHIREIGRR